MNQDKNVEKFTALQIAVLEATKQAIEENAPGMPLTLLTTYMRKIGGHIAVEGRGKTGPNKFHPFRIRVTVAEEPNILKAERELVVEQVIGWG